MAILHRFSSPSWWNHLIHHVPTDFSNTDAFDKIVRLQVKIRQFLSFFVLLSNIQSQTGQAIVLAPSGIGLFENNISENENQVSATENVDDRVLSRFGRRYLIVKTRRRVTADGGASVLVINRQEH